MKQVIAMLQSLKGIVHFCDAAWIADHFVFFTASSVGNSLRLFVVLLLTLFNDSITFLV